MLVGVVLREWWLNPNPLSNVSLISLQVVEYIRVVIARNSWKIIMIYVKEQVIEVVYCRKSETDNSSIEIQGTYTKFKFVITSKDQKMNCGTSSSVWRSEQLFGGPSLLDKPQIS